jgi:hypothetical protein
MKTTYFSLLLAINASLLAMHAYGQHNKQVWEPFLYNTSATNHQEPKEITSLRISYQQFMEALSLSKFYNFNGLRSASNITIGTSDEESLQYIREASQIIRNEIWEQLPEAVMSADFKNYTPPVSTSKQGMIIGLRKDLDIYRRQMAHSHQK